MNFVRAEIAAANDAYQSQSARARYPGLLLVAALHVLVIWAVMTGTARKGLEILKKPLQAVVIQEVIIPPAPPPPPPPPVKEILRSEATTPSAPAPAPTVQREAALPAAAPPPPEPAVREPAPVAPTVSAPPLALPAEPPKQQTASLEGEYVAKLRLMLNSTKRYPTGRQASQQRPTGRVRVWFTLTRSGVLIDLGVMESSNSNLLDDAALATVRRGIYPAFPANTWAGQEQHKFSAEIEFAAPSAE